ncbi:MAG TPA: MASE1 domain-containing protein, partial [Polyangiales bacterium]|nr:MASE1 domain-containing protein [Polyangiales bacterium]
MGKGADVHPVGAEARVARLLPSLAFGAAYFACAQAGRLLSAPGQTYISFWLPAGVYAAALLLVERRRWPGLLLAALVANLAFDLSHGTSLPVTLLFYLANTLQAVLGAWLMQRLVAERPTLGTLRELSGLIGLAALGSTLIGAWIGAGTLVYFRLSSSFMASLAVWWGSCAMAVALVAPFMLTWLQPASRRAYALGNAR